MATATTPVRRKPSYPNSLTDLNRFRKTVHGHDGSSRIVMVRKTDQRTFASLRNGEEPQLQTITRETIETFRGQRTECKVTTEKKACGDKIPQDLTEVLSGKIRKSGSSQKIKKMSSARQFQEESLTAHNSYRQKHGLTPLKLSSEICKESQKWADHLLKKGTLEHSGTKDYGENIFCISSTNPNFTISGDEPVRNWYDEIKFHTFGMEPKSLSSGHFTQIVWKETKELGVAFAKLNGKIIVVANYFPPGNIIGRFARNVPPLGGFSIDNNNDDIEAGMSNINITSRFTSCSSSKRDLSNGTEGDFEDDFLKAHNDYRERHGVRPLKLDRQLCKYSEEWAKILASKNNPEHRKNCPYGENIYCLFSSDPNYTITGHTPVDIWYDEIKYHPFGREPNSLKSGHFTQVVWKTSESLGVGMAKNRQGYIYVVANYSPAGNFVGHYTENVPPLRTSPIQERTKSDVKQQKESDKYDDDYFDEFTLDGLRVHNEYRRKHGVSELILSRKLCDFAKEWAETCAQTGNMAHRPNNQYGENIFSMYSSDYSHTPSARDAVKKWYDEIREHAFGVETINTRTLHFSQVIWRNSTELGIALAKNKRGQSYVVANYNPRGNYMGQFNSNVPRSKS